MQNFPNNPAPPPPGFTSRGGSMVGSPYPPHMSDPQISPRTSEDYSAMQQPQPILQSHGQLLHLRGQQGHPGQVSHIHGYGSRRGVADVPQAAAHSGSSNNSYRKENMDYYYSLGGRDRNRRGGAGYGAVFGYSNMDGHLPHQYRHMSVPGSSSGLMSPYPVDYSTSAGGASGGGAGGGSFSPSQQFTLSQSASIQPATSAEMLQRQQKYPSHQGLHQGHRAYSLAAHRISSQFGQYPPLGTPAVSAGMYNSPPQRYETGSSGGSMDSKINSPTHSHPNSTPVTAASHNSGHQEHMGQSFSSTAHPPYSPQSHPVHKLASRRTPQHNLGTSFDASLKMAHVPPGHMHSKNSQSSVSSSPAGPHQTSQDMSKSPMHSQNQPSHLNQNFSPISNPSPAPSAVHSPSCSSSSSPLMGVSDGLGNNLPPTLQPASHSSLLNPRNSQSHVRPPPTMPQLSPTPSSNSSISSCSSSTGSKAAGVNQNVVGAALTQNQMGVGPRGGQREGGSSSLYPQDKLSQDPGLNSLNALTSQVANLPNTVQHMMLTDTVLSQRKIRDGSHQSQPQQPSTNQQKLRNTNSAGHTLTNEESSDILAPDLEERRKEHGDALEVEKVKQKCGPEPKPVNNYPATQSQKQTQMGQVRPGFNLQTDSKITESSLKPFSQNKTPETQTPSSPSPLSIPPFAEQSPSAPTGHPASSPSTSSPTRSIRSNSLVEPDLAHVDDKSVLRDKKNQTLKDEKPTEPHGHKEPSKLEMLDKAESLQLLNIKVEHSGPSKENKNEKDEKKGSTQHFPSKNLNTEQSNIGAVGVIVSARSEQNPDTSKQPEATSHYGASCHLGKLNYSEEKHSINMFKDGTSHNGGGEMGVETFPAHYDVTPKTEFPQGMPSNHCLSGPYKFGTPEVQYNACMGSKNKGRTEPVGGMGANRYQDFHQPQSNFGSVHRKDSSLLAQVSRGGVGPGMRSQDSSSHLQQPFPSLLQEVLQGYHLDRPYGRPEQISGAHHHGPNLTHYHTRLPYRMMENMRPHGVGPSVMTGAGVHQLAPGKPHTQNQSQALDQEMRQGLLHPTWDLEAQRPKGEHGVSLEKTTLNMSPGHSTNVQQSLDSSVGTPTKHINLADYSLPQRKPPSIATPSSAVQQLLLQENDSLPGSVEPLSQTQAQASSSSGRRSVICDVSPSRRTTPERERGQCGTSAPSVIQQPHSSSGLSEQGCTREDEHGKRGQETKETSKVIPKDSAMQAADGHDSVQLKEEPGKSLHGPMDLNSDLHRQSGSKAEAISKHHLSPNTLSSPPRRKPYSHGLDGAPAGFSAYVLSETVEGSKLNTHRHSLNPFHTLSSPSHIPVSANKIHAYPHPLSFQHPNSMDDRFDWSANSNRPKDIPIHHNPEQKVKIQSPTDGFPSQHHLRQHSYSDSHYDMKMWESYAERDGAGNQQVHSAATHDSAGSQQIPARVPKVEADVSRGITEESSKSFQSPAAASAVGPGSIGGSSVTLSIHRPTKTGSSAEMNPLMMRRRVRSFISPIPAKRQHQDFSSHRGAHQSPAPLCESKQLNDNDPSSMDTHSKLSSPSTPYHPPSATSPLQGKTKVLPPRKGRGLKLEEIVQKITPNKKGSYNNSHVDSDYAELSHFSSDLPEPETGAPFFSVPSREGGCLPYLEEAHSLDELLPFRADEAYSCDSQVLKQSSIASSSGMLRNVPTDFDFGLGTAGSSGTGTGEDDKDEFTLLGPLPPPPPLPCPVQGSPPPSSSALSDIQQFTNTYQQLETRRGEQSAANLLRQKLQETGMGFDDYSGADFYGESSPHSQSPGHHLLSRPPQHQLASGRMAASDSKSSESIVPKGYFPSGKKKGRPVGSVNKQKRAQVQVQSAATGIPAAAQTPPAVVSAAATPQIASNSSPPQDIILASTLSEQKPSPSLDLDDQIQEAKPDVESEDNQPEVDLKPTKLKQKKAKEGNEGSSSKGRQWRRRRGLASTEDLEAQSRGVENTSLSVILQDARKNAFSPYIHVERKIAEIGAVCTIINSEDEKSKGGGKASNSGSDVHSSVSLTTQVVRKERETERLQEKGIAEQTNSAMQSGKSLPTSGYVLSGPVVSETSQTGRFLCCLCQKWANYKNLGDLYGPFYPAEYAAKFPKNQPQVRQILSNSGTATSGPNLSSVPTEPNAADDQLTHPADIKTTDSTCTVDQSINPAPPATAGSTAFPTAPEDLSCSSAQLSSTVVVEPAENWDPTPELAPSTPKLPDLENEMAQRWQQKAEELQQRPQHRKLTSHPRFKRRHKSSEDVPRTIPINSKASLPFQPPPPSVDSLGPLAQLAQLPLVPLDPQELWVHESCIVWTSGIYLVNGRLYGLQEALDGARETSCSHCEMAGSTLGCYSKGCTLRYHYMCAIEADCCLNEDNFSLRCPKHKFSLNSRPAKSTAAYLEQSERG